MKLSFIFELLLIFVLVAFAASAVIESPNLRKGRKSSVKKHGKVTNKRQDSTTNTANRFCNCSVMMCNCCREFNIPVVALKGPGCASLQYLKGDRLAISMRFGDRVLTNTTISSKKPQPVCMPLPGGVSKFCGRVYNIGRQGDEFNACLGLELRALNNIEAALRVSCFRFGPKGLRVEPPQPLPIIDEEDDDDDDEDDDDDDDDDDFGFDDSDSVDYGTFSVLDDDFIGEYFQGTSGSSSTNKKKVTTTTTTKAPLRRLTRKPVAKPVKVTQKKPLRRKATPKPVKVNTTPKNKVVKTTTTTEESNMGALQHINLPIMLNELEPFNSSIDDPTASATKLEDMNSQVLPEAKPTLVTMVEVPTTTLTETTSTISEVPTITEMEQPNESTEPGTKLEPTNLIETSTIIETTTSVVEASTQSQNKDEDDDSDESSEEDDDDEDPISEVVGDVLDDESSESAEKTDKPVKVNVTGEKSEESKEIEDDIVDGVVDTFAGDDSDEQDDDDEDDEESRTLIKSTKRRFQGRQSRDMWLDRLHW